MLVPFHTVYNPEDSKTAYIQRLADLLSNLVQDANTLSERRSDALSNTFVVSADNIYKSYDILCELHEKGVY